MRKFSAFYGTRKFLTLFITAHHYSQFWARSVHSTTSQPIYLTSIFILLSHLSLSIKICLFPSGLPPKTYMHLSSLPYVPHVPPVSFLSILPSGDVQIMKLFTMQSVLLPCYHVSPRSKSSSTTSSPTFSLMLAAILQAVLPHYCTIVHFTS